MREPSWSDLVRLPERQAVERFFDGRNDRYLLGALIAAAPTAAIAALGLTASAKPLAAVLWVLLLGLVVAIFAARGGGAFDRRPRLWLLAFLAALVAVFALGLPEPMAVYVFAGFVFPAGLVVLRLRPAELLGVAAGCLAAAGWAIYRLDPATAGPPWVTALLAVGWTAAASTLGAWLTRRARLSFLDQWRVHALRDREHSRMRSELDDARTVQLSMLPRAAPELPWVELASTSLPASEVGGDYFGYFPLDRKRLAIAVGDVAGHGMASGLVLSGLRSGLHLLRGDLERPVEVLERLDRMLRETTPGRMFVTLQIALLDAARGELVLAGAGHPPLLLLPAAGGALALGAPAPPLGTGLGPGFVEVRHRLAAGDVVVLYTDGLLEVENRAGEPLGEQRLIAEAARGVRTGTARGVRDALLGALSRFKGDVEAGDDLTLVVARITGAADELLEAPPIDLHGDPETPLPPRGRRGAEPD